eukprot:363148-Chlamydomonas_euryale.AAC.2
MKNENDKKLAKCVFSAAADHRLDHSQPITTVQGYYAKLANSSGKADNLENVRSSGHHARYCPHTRCIA